MTRKLITCVQPCCGRVTHDFYRVDVMTALKLPDVQAGATCSHCFENIVRRETREQTKTHVRGVSLCARGDS